MKYTSETNPLLARLRYHTSGAIARGEGTAITEIASPAAKALANGAKRPAKTSKLNPIVISSAPGGEEFRISPRLSHLKANGVTAAKAAGRAEAMAGYVSKNSFGMPGKAEARLNAANMARYARTHKMLSRADASAIVEFAETEGARLAGLMGDRTRTARLYNKAHARMSRGDGYQPFGYDMPTLRTTKPGWAKTLRTIGDAHNSLPKMPARAK